MLMVVCVCLALTAILDDRLALVVAIALVLIHQQRLVALALIRPGTHGTGSGSEYDRHQHEGGHYPHGDDFSQGESLTWDEQKGILSYPLLLLSAKSKSR